MIFRTKKALSNLHFWVGGTDGEIYVGISDEHGGIGERVIVTSKIEDVMRKREKWNGLQ